MDNGLKNLSDSDAQQFMLSLHGLNLSADQAKSIVLNHPIPKNLEDWHYSAAYKSSLILKTTQNKKLLDYFSHSTKFFSHLNRNGRQFFAEHYLNFLAKSYGFTAAPRVIVKKLHEKTAGQFQEPSAYNTNPQHSFGTISLSDNAKSGSHIDKITAQNFLNILSHEFCHALEYALSIHLLNPESPERTALKKAIYNPYIEQNKDAFFGSALISQFNRAAPINDSGVYLGSLKHGELYREQFRERHAYKHGDRLTKHFNTTVQVLNKKVDTLDMPKALDKINKALFMELYKLTSPPKVATAYLTDLMHKVEQLKLSGSTDTDHNTVASRQALLANKIKSLLPANQQANINIIARHILTMRQGVYVKKLENVHQDQQMILTKL
jgi:hypothetical protein